MFIVLLRSFSYNNYRFLITWIDTQSILGNPCKVRTYAQLHDIECIIEKVSTSGPGRISESPIR